MKRRFAVALVLACVACPEIAKADGANAAAAEQLFNDGRKLMEAGHFAEACPKLESSEDLDPGIGTLMYLADCYERTQKPASAWARWREAADRAKQENDKRGDIADKRARALEGQLAHLTIVVAQEIDGLVVHRDDAVIEHGAWKVAIPVDPGEHVLRAEAPGRVTWTKNVTIAPQQSLTVDVPILDPAPVAAPVPIPIERKNPAKPEEPPRDGTTQRTWGLIAGGAGIVGVGLGAAFGIIAKSSYDSSNSGHCVGDRCDSTGADDRHTAFSQATISTVAFIVGAVAVAGGAALYFTAPPKSKSKMSPSITTDVSPHGAAAGIRFSF